MNFNGWQTLFLTYKPLWCCLLTREDLPFAICRLPVLDQHLLPDDFPHDLRADAEQLGEWGVKVVEAVQQNL